MNVHGLRQKIETEATYAGDAIRQAINARKNAYVSGELLNANRELKDVFQGQKLEELLNKAGQNAEKSWNNTHKIQAFVAKHSDKITAKTAVIATGVVVGVIALVNFVKSLFSSKQEK